MSKNRFSIVATILLAASFPTAQAAHLKHSGASDNPRETLRELEISAKQAQDDADQLRAYSSNVNISADAHISELNALKREINTMGKELASLENERPSLSLWERQAIDKVAPLLTAEVQSADDAIRFVNNHRSYLWSPDYRSDASSMWSDSHQIADTLRDYLKYSQTHDQEQNLKTRLGVAGE